MENNVVSLGTAKRLKAAGFPQTSEASEHAYFTHDDGRPAELLRGGSDNPHRHFAAPTAQELAEQLPRIMGEQGEDVVLEIFPDTLDGVNGWTASYHGYHWLFGPTLADQTSKEGRNAN